MQSPNPPIRQSPDAGPRAPVVITAAELYLLTMGVWVGGIFILTLMPILLIPRVGPLFGIMGAYSLFFLAWQPIQIITQRRVGVPAALIRMFVFVTAAAVIAFYLRDLLGRMASPIQ